MKKYYNPPLALEPFHPERLNRPARPRVRYLGFERIDGGRCLSFSVKSLGHDSVDITIEISDASFKGASGISIQDAAPMAYEKLVQLSAAEGTLESKRICLTESDIAQYIARHLSSQKRACSMIEKRRRSDVAA
jgi:hypothetical protein